MNEEFDGTYNTPNPEYYNNINAYNQIFVDTVRKAGGKNNSRYLLIPGWNTDIITRQATAIHIQWKQSSLSRMTAG